LSEHCRKIGGAFLFGYVIWTAHDDEGAVRTVENLSVLILAGGRSRRMGQDKAWLRLDGAALVERVARRVLPVAEEVLFSANAAEPFAQLTSSLPVPAAVVADLFPGAGPLAGIHAGLRAARGDLLLALAVDLPFVNLALVRHIVGLAQGWDAVVPQMPHPTTGELVWEPLHALYRRSCLPAITARLAAGERRTVSFLSDVRTRPLTLAEITPFDPELRSFFNVNTADDWHDAQRLAAAS
jgi:molybdopterin-guanine dinucleotide biosynthesis protein A